jgi:hypothetical protein
VVSSRCVLRFIRDPPDRFQARVVQSAALGREPIKWILESGKF